MASRAQLDNLVDEFLFGDAFEIDLIPTFEGAREDEELEQLALLEAMQLPIRRLVEQSLVLLFALLVLALIDGVVARLAASSPLVAGSAIT